MALHSCVIILYLTCGLLGSARLLSLRADAVKSCIRGCIEVSLARRRQETLCEAGQDCKVLSGVQALRTSLHVRPRRDVTLPYCCPLALPLPFNHITGLYSQVNGEHGFGRPSCTLCIETSDGTPPLPLLGSVELALHRSLQ